MCREEEAGLEGDGQCGTVPCRRTIEYVREIPDRLDVAVERNRGRSIGRRTRYIGLVFVALPMSTPHSVLYILSSLPPSLPYSTNTMHLPTTAILATLVGLAMSEPEPAAAAPSSEAKCAAQRYRLYTMLGGSDERTLTREIVSWMPVWTL